MLTNGENNLIKLVAVMPDGKTGMPCGACREFLMQLGGAAGEIELLCDYETKRTIRLQALVPQRWGADKIETNG